jgi:hypothetical protein
MRRCRAVAEDDRRLRREPTTSNCSISTSSPYTNHDGAQFSEYSVLVRLALVVAQIRRNGLSRSWGKYPDAERIGTLPQNCRVLPGDEKPRSWRWINPESARFAASAI